MLRQAIAFCAVLVLATPPGLAGEARSIAGFAPPLPDGVARDASADRSPLAAYRFLAGRDWPALRFHAPTPLDWRRAGALAIEVENPSDAPFPLLLRLDDDPRADGGDASLTGTAEVAPHARVTVVLPFGETPPGMRALPPAGAGLRPGDQAVTERRGRVDLGHVVALHVSGLRSDRDRTLLIGAPALLAGGAEAASGPLADTFGQSIRGTWPEKVASLDDLRRKLRAATTETDRLAAAAYPAVDKYGGVDAAHPLPATGFFRVAVINGRWTLVTPAGHRFFSLGVDTVAVSNPTRVAGRASLFNGLPRPAPEMLDVGEDNAARGLGPAWHGLWPRQTIRWLEAWGFNTLGNWSGPEVTALGRMAYVRFADVEGAGAVVPGTDGRHLPDPFDPSFPAVADSVAARMTAGARDDPWLLGYFSGNELPWGRADRPEEGVAARVLRLGPDSPAKRAFVERLRDRYGTVEALASAWSMPMPATWDGLLARRVELPSELTTAARGDLIAFGGAFADRYFATVSAALKWHDPNHLYLGTRFAGAPPEIMAACARSCDVVSVNVYGRSPEEEAAAWRGLGRPLLVGEFHFGSTDRGSFWAGMVPVADEAARGPAYADYVMAAVRDPAIVGTHWFQYADEPLTGRPYDGENGHIGLVAVTGIPFGGFVAAVAAANREAMRTFERGATGRGSLDAWQLRGPQ